MVVTPGAAQRRRPAFSENTRYVYQRASARYVQRVYPADTTKRQYTHGAGGKNMPKRGPNQNMPQLYQARNLRVSTSSMLYNDIIHAKMAQRGGHRVIGMAECVWS